MPKNKKGSIVMDIKIIYKPTDKIVPYENNPRLNDEAVEPVANSIKQFGFKVPIIIDSSNVIVAGHTRLKAAKQLGMDKVPCIVADDLTEEQIKVFRLADNKVSEFSSWDYEKLEEELNNIGFKIVNEVGLVMGAKEMNEYYKNQPEPIKQYFNKMKEYLPTAWLTAIAGIPFPKASKEILFICTKG